MFTLIVDRADLTATDAHRRDPIRKADRRRRADQPDQLVLLDANGWRWWLRLYALVWAGCVACFALLLTLVLFIGNGA